MFEMICVGDVVEKDSLMRYEEKISLRSLFYFFGKGSYYFCYFGVIDLV